MKLYLDDVLLNEDPKENDLDAALERLRRAGGGCLKLCGEGRAWVGATCDENGWFLDVQQRDNMLFGMLADEERATAALKEFLAGFTPRLPWKPVRPRKGETILSLVAGDAAHPDCPLCRMMGL